MLFFRSNPREKKIRTFLYFSTVKNIVLEGSYRFKAVKKIYFLDSINKLKLWIFLSSFHTFFFSRSENARVNQVPL